MAKVNKQVIVIMFILVLLVVGIVYYKPTTGSGIVTGQGTCAKFVDVSGLSFSSFNQMRAQVPDLASASDEQIKSLGLQEQSGGVYICR